ELHVFGSKVQIGVVERQHDLDGPQLGRLGELQLCLVRRVQKPALMVLNLGGDGELIILFGQALAVLFDDTANGDAPDDGRGDGKAFDHDGTPENEKAAMVGGRRGGWCGDGQASSRKRRDPGRTLAYWV